METTLLFVGSGVATGADQRERGDERSPEEEELQDLETSFY